MLHIGEESLVSRPPVSCNTHQKNGSGYNEHQQETKMVIVLEQGNLGTPILHTTGLMSNAGFRFTDGLHGSETASSFHNNKLLQST